MNGRGGEGTARGARVEVVRGGTVESRHEVHVAAVGADGRLEARAGDPGFRTFARSSIKALQALPLVEDGGADRYGLTGAELALCCASHGGEPFHVAAARSILSKIGESEDALACGAHAPMHEPSARALRDAGETPGRIHNNCSGKHAGMLALARFHGWPAEGYHREGHALQARMLAEVARWAEVPREAVATAVDGCGVMTFAVPLAALAGAFARFGAAAERGEAGASRLVAAMRNHPEYVAGTGRLCTELIRVTGGRVIVKVGAEGVYVAAVPREGMGVALKVEDGAQRAVEPALLGVLRRLGVLTEEEYAQLERFAEPVLTNTRGDRVGRIRAVVELEARGG